MDKESPSPKPADSDVAQLTLEQMRTHWEKMFKNAQHAFPSNLPTEENAVPLPPFGLTPTMIMQLAMMQMPLMSIQEAKSNMGHMKSEVTNNKSNNTAHGLLDNFRQQSSPSMKPPVDDIKKRKKKEIANSEDLVSYSNAVNKSLDTPDTEEIEVMDGMDEKDLKRLKRKQSNRESARRSRMRKQAECEGLMAENADLKAEILQLRKQQKELKEVIVSLENRINDQ